MPEDFSGLQLAVESTEALLSNFEHALRRHNTAVGNDAEVADLDPIAVLHTAATLIRAQVTKLSLLMINKPFTPSAIIKVLHELSTGPVPILVNAVETCDSQKWTKTMSVEARHRALTVLSELRNLIKETPLDSEAAKVLSDSKGKKSKSGDASAAKDSLASAGVVWAACDALAELHTVGLSGILVFKANQFKETLADAITELHEWKEEAAEDDEDEGDAHSDDESEDGMLTLGKSLPAGPSAMRTTLENGLKQLGLIKSLYAGIIKHRLRRMPPDQQRNGEVGSRTDRIHDQQIQKGFFVRLDLIMEALKAIPDETDEFASTCYELEEDGSKTHMAECVALAKRAADSAKLDSNGEKDDFSSWIEKWASLIK